MTMSLTSRQTEYLLLLAVLAGAFWLFSAGISGGFLFDDYNNLQGLATLTQTPGLDSTLAYVLNGLSSTLGRPLSLASFAAQYSDWPGNPAGFKIVNILIHLFNGWLVFTVVRALLRLQPDTRAATWIPLATATLWVLHPLQVSTVLYVVQRMTELSALFMLLGLRLYLLGRESALQNNVRRAYSFMTLGIITGLGLGVLSKENAALMPLLVLVIEFTLLNQVQRPAAWRVWSSLFLVLPTLLLLGYLAMQFQSFSAQYALRDFTFAERLFTEARILFDYLGKILLPTPGAFGLLFDDFRLSRGLFDPLSTVFAVAGIAGLITGGIILRRREPVLAFAILWFFAAHLLESSVIPLELYFEHRNYLALFGPAFALAYYAARALRQLETSPIRSLVVVGFSAYLCLIAIITHQEARLWGNPFLQATAWSLSHPDSRRLTYLYADALIKRGYASQTVEVYAGAAERWPDSAVPLIGALEAHCFLDEPGPAISNAVQRIAGQHTEKNELVLFLSRLVNVQSGGDCPTLSAPELLALLDAAQSNAYLSGQRGLILTMKSQVHSGSGDLPAATETLAAAFEARPRLATALDVAVLYARQGQPESGRQFLLSAQQHPRIDWREKQTMNPYIESLLRELDASGQ
ncbi:MAG: hypothetical protein RQ736_09155 [Thiogranum sp.]|nr:hypothetical protein [Thiogranum sp.]